MSIGNRIRIARNQKRMTQKELGDTIGVSQTVIHKYENDMSEPSTTNVPTLAKVLGITTDYLLFGNDNFDSGEFEIALMLIKQLPTHEKAALQVIFEGLISANNLTAKYDQLIMANK